MNAIAEQPTVEFPESGIYAILNTVNDKVYIGSAVNLYQRRHVHINRLNNNIHHSKYLQAAWLKYSQTAFIFTILEFCNKEKLIEREQHWLDRLKSYNRKFGYNVSLIAGSPLGNKRSEETKIKMSLNRKGNNYRRDKLKWPHELGCKCQCNICDQKRVKYWRDRYIRMSFGLRKRRNYSQKEKIINEGLSLAWT